MSLTHQLVSRCTLLLKKHLHLIDGYSPLNFVQMGQWFVRVTVRIKCYTSGAALDIWPVLKIRYPAANQI